MVSIGILLTVNVTLEVGSLAENVDVTLSPLGSELQTANATIGNTINLKQLELLPNLGRDATSLLSLQPGVTPRGDSAGSYMDQNTFTIDEGNNTDNKPVKDLRAFHNLQHDADAAPRLER